MPSTVNPLQDTKNGLNPAYTVAFYMCEYTTVDLRSKLSTAGTDPEEIYANEFAACLLMPEEEVKRMNKAGLDAFDMAVAFGVSRDAMQFRLKNLGLSA
jgi:hypothetical protein